MTDVAGTHITAHSPNHGAARKALIAFLLLATVVWIGIAIGANMRTPGIVGLATTVVGGLCAALLTATIGGWIALKLAHPWTPLVLMKAGDFETPFAPAVAATVAAQAPIARRRIENDAWRMPVGAAIAVAVWSLAVLLGAPGGLFDFSGLLLAGGFAGYGWSRLEARREMAEAYFQRGVGTLAQMQGGLSWHRTASIDHRRLTAQGVLPPLGEANAEGEITGVHEGVGLRIASVSGKAPAGANAGGFTGLLIELDAPGLSVNAMDQLAAQRPAVITLIDQLATLPGIGKPVCAVAGGRLSIVLPETLKPRVFDPPGEPGAPAAASRLARLRQLLLAVQPIAAALAPPAPQPAPPQA